MNLVNRLKCAWLVEFVLNGNFCCRVFTANTCYKVCSAVLNIFVKIFIYICIVVEFVDDDEI